MKKINEIPEIDRPRAKLEKNGAQSLSDLELIAILLGSGSKKQDVLALASSILNLLDKSNQDVRVTDIMRIDGVGLAKASIIVAALEFARRRIRPEGFKITVPSDVVPLIKHLTNRKQEHFICVSLNGANEVIESRIVSVGLINRAPVHPREVFADPISDRASSVVVAHNHPAGDLLPSKEDIEITKRLKKSGEILGINLLDHIIFNHKGFYSFLEHSKL